MPETSIGFFPDIGASHLLTRCPGYSGIYLGLTGARLGAQDALKAGLIQQLVSAEHLPNLLHALLNEDLSTDAYARVDHCLLAHAMPNSVKGDCSINPLIDDCFSHSSVELIRESLQKVNESWSTEVDKMLAQKSPLSLKVTLAQLQQAKGLTLAQCLRMDYDMVSHFMQAHDFYEGVRALLIDKDKKPQWEPACLGFVTENMVLDYFVPTHCALDFIE